MKAFPMFIRTTGRRVVIVGGGEQAAQKARLLIKTDATLDLVAWTLDPELRALVDDGRATQHDTLTPAVFDNAAMAFVGTGCPGLDAAAQVLAKAARCPVNVVDQPELCDITTPALVDRDPIVIAIGSEGTAPVLTREIKTRLEQMLPPSIGGLAALAGRLRPSVTQHVPRSRRRPFWAWVFKGAPRQSWVRGAERDAARVIKDAIAAGGAIDRTDAGHVAVIGAVSGQRDLLTLRAVEWLQEADTIFCDRSVDENVLELARRDAERLFVDDNEDAELYRRLVDEAQAGHRVVRLVHETGREVVRALEHIEAMRDAGGAALQVELHESLRMRHPPRLERSA